MNDDDDPHDTRTGERDDDITLADDSGAKLAEALPKTRS